jgi:hypothetical protein
MIARKEKTQKVRFGRGDKRPANYTYKLSYEKKLVKKAKKIVWHVIEKPTGSILSEFFFEEDADKLAKFQNKNKVWQVNGGIVPHLCFKGKRKTI